MVRIPFPPQHTAILLSLKPRNFIQKSTFLRFGVFLENERLNKSKILRFPGKTDKFESEVSVLLNQSLFGWYSEILIIIVVFMPLCHPTQEFCYYLSNHGVRWR